MYITKRKDTLYLIMEFKGFMYMLNHDGELIEQDLFTLRKWPNYSTILTEL